MSVLVGTLGVDSWWVIIAVKMSNRLRDKRIKTIKEILDQPMTAGNIRHLLVDTRILLENAGKQKQYPTLNFYCDWILHPVMNRKTANKLLEDVDEVLFKLKSHSDRRPDDFENTLGYQIGFYGFEEELEAFLGSIGVEMAEPGHVVNWHKLEQLYCQNLISEVLLSYGGKKTLNLIHTGKAEIYRVGELPQPNIAKTTDTLPYGIKWTFEGDGDEMYVFAIECSNPTAECTWKNDSSQLIVRRKLHLRSAPQTPSRRSD
jgi:hypothetical protein